MVSSGWRPGTGRGATLGNGERPLELDVPRRDRDEPLLAEGHGVRETTASAGLTGGLGSGGTGTFSGAAPSLPPGPGKPADPKGAPVTRPRDTRLRNRLFFATVLAAVVVGLWLAR